MMRGYLGNPEATAATLDAGGWLHTGDIVTVDSDGWFRVTDRIKELIKYKGYQVAPAELEEILLAHPAVADAAVVRQSGQDRRRSAQGVRRAQGPASAAELMAWVAERVSPYKRVRRVEFTDRSPSPRRARSCAGCWPSASGPHVRRILTGTVVLVSGGGRGLGGLLGPHRASRRGRRGADRPIGR